MEKKVFYKLGSDKDKLIDNLLEFNVLKLCGEKAFLLYTKDELIIKLNFEKADINYEKGYLEVLFAGARLEVNEETKVLKVKRPDNIIGKYNWCYRIANKEGELLAYIVYPV